VTSAVREESRIRQTMAAEVLGPDRYVSKPEAFHLWLTVPEPWNRVEFATHLRSHRVGVVLSETFTVADAPPAAVRVCLGGPVNREECRHSLEIIADALEHLPA
jgi:DNA-binding transcriptional MocR family regulator